MYNKYIFLVEDNLFVLSIKIYLLFVNNIRLFTNDFLQIIF
jgi:hypothetical protein